MGKEYRQSIHRNIREKKCPTSLLEKECKLKTMWYHFVPMSLAKIKTKTNYKVLCAGTAVEKQGIPQGAGETAHWYNHLEGQFSRTSQN